MDNDNNNDDDDNNNNNIDSLNCNPDLILYSLLGITDYKFKYEKEYDATNVWKLYGSSSLIIDTFISIPDISIDYPNEIYNLITTDYKQDYMLSIKSFNMALNLWNDTSLWKYINNNTIKDLNIEDVKKAKFDHIAKYDEAMRRFARNKDRQHRRDEIIKKQEEEQAKHIENLLKNRQINKNNEIKDDKDVLLDNISDDEYVDEHLLHEFDEIEQDEIIITNQDNMKFQVYIYNKIAEIYILLKQDKLALQSFWNSKICYDLYYNEKYKNDLNKEKEIIELRNFLKQQEDNIANYNDENNNYDQMLHKNVKRAYMFPFYTIKTMTIKPADEIHQIIWANIARICYYLKEYQTSLNINYSLSLANTINKQQIAIIYNNMAVSLHALYRYQEAYDYFEQAYQILISLHYTLTHPKLNLIRQNINKIKTKRKKS